MRQLGMKLCWWQSTAHITQVLFYTNHLNLNWEKARDLFTTLSNINDVELPLREKCPYSDFFWFLLSRIPGISPYSVQMRENRDQKFSRLIYIFKGDVKRFEFQYPNKILKEETPKKLNFLTKIPTILTANKAGNYLKPP